MADQRNGDFSQLNFRGNRPIYDPATTRPNPAGGGAVRDAFPGNRIPAARMTEFSRLILGLYPAPNLDTATGNNFVARLSDISDNNQGMARIDHRFNEQELAVVPLSVVRRRGQQQESHRPGRELDR